jgi:hypothetical protein
VAIAAGLGVELDAAGGRGSAGFEGAGGDLERRLGFGICRLRHTCRSYPMVGGDCLGQGSWPLGVHEALGPLAGGVL